MAVDVQAGCPGGPRSWAEDLNTYRSTRGSQALATCSTVPKTYGRSSAQADPTVTAERCSRHGWGDVSLLKQDGLAGIPHRSGPAQKPEGKAKVSSPRGADGRKGLFGVLSHTEAGGKDSWIGHPLIQPNKGKKPTSAPVDPRGRRDLFDVIHARAPGTPSDDSWLGHHLIQPAKGKASVPGPEQRRGRQDLSDTFTMSILRADNKAELLKKGVDPLADAWCGHIQVDPSKGKAPVKDPGVSQDIMLGATFKQPPSQDWTDFKRRHTKLVPNCLQDTARQVLTGEAPLDLSYKPGKRPVPESVGTRLVPRADLYANMTYRPLDDLEQKVYSRAWDDQHTGGRKHLPVPGSSGFGQGKELLTWHPEQAVGRFVPFGKLAQEGRTTRPNIPQGTMRLKDQSTCKF